MARCVAATALPPRKLRRNRCNRAVPPVRLDPLCRRAVCSLLRHLIELQDGGLSKPLCDLFEYHVNNPNFEVSCSTAMLFLRRQQFCAAADLWCCLVWVYVGGISHPVTAVDPATLSPACPLQVASDAFETLTAMLMSNKAAVFECLNPNGDSASLARYGELFGMYNRLLQSDNYVLKVC